MKCMGRVEDSLRFVIYRGNLGFCSPTLCLILGRLAFKLPSRWVEVRIGVDEFGRGR
jgi:hypothetical protein